MSKVKEFLWTWASDKALTALLGAGVITAIGLRMQSYFWSLPLEDRALFGISMLTLAYACCLKVARKWGVGAHSEDDQIQALLIANFDDGVVTVVVRNLGATDEFSARIYAIFGTDGPTPLPMYVRWRSHVSDTVHITKGQAEKLEFARIPMRRVAPFGFEPAEWLPATGVSLTLEPRWVEPSIAKPIKVFFSLRSRKRELVRKFFLTINLVSVSRAASYQVVSVSDCD